MTDTAVNARLLTLEHVLFFTLAALLRDSPKRAEQISLVLNGTEALLNRQAAEGDPEAKRDATEALAYWPDLRRRLSGVGHMPGDGD